MRREALLVRRRPVTSRHATVSRTPPSGPVTAIPPWCSLHRLPPHRAVTKRHTSRRPNRTSTAAAATLPLSSAELGLIHTSRTIRTTTSSVMVRTANWASAPASPTAWYVPIRCPNSGPLRVCRTMNRLLGIEATGSERPRLSERRARTAAQPPLGAAAQPTLWPPET
ncbi:hypothetical protein [Streptomyces sp. rh206]|uniref:hypothetical protein n=1 Tax=Streptomyces sp. rh206 TaxID=2034270 RepID=UPI0015CF4BD7|nr:hypothetical protein [Streptomyces sp. rh206]